VSEDLPRSSPPRAIVLTQFDPPTLPTLLEEVERSIGEGATVYLGSYGANADVGRQINAADHLYAPMYALKEGDWYWTNRHPEAGPEETSPLARTLPPLAKILAAPLLDRLRWGIELGRRFRDQMYEKAESNGVEVGSWQFDEVRSQVADADGRPLRDFTRGIVRGLHAGRPARGDRSIPGIVWFAQEGLKLGAKPLDAELTQFWLTLVKNSALIVGEEYPFFRGRAVSAARSFGGGHQTLSAAPEQLRREIALRYVVGITPGYNLKKAALRGNVDHRPPSFVNRWRDTYVIERKRLRPRGFAQFDFTDKNSNATVIRDAVASLGSALQT
jgi:hypothetical protein